MDVGISIVKYKDSFGKEAAFETKIRRASTESDFKLFKGGIMDRDMMRKQIHQDAARQLLEQTRLSGDEVTSHFKRALAPTYWEELNPSLSIGSDITNDGIETTVIDSRHGNKLVNQFMKEGYFKTESMILNSTLSNMRECVEVLRKEGWPPVFSFVYDQFWMVSRLPSLVQLLSSILGPGYRQIPPIWTHYVQPRRGAAGWPPHIDNPNRSGRVTVWIPLSDATLDNGCMYLIPKDLISTKIADNFTKLETVASQDLMTLLQGSRALPARAGEVLCWDFGIIHWGSTCGREGNPRISISQEFIGESLEPMGDELPLFDLHLGLPTFALRLYAIGTAIIAYQGFNPLLIRYIELAKRLVKHIGIA
jgi:hypothetical protein